jgi:hypothetical protein
MMETVVLSKKSGVDEYYNNNLPAKVGKHVSTCTKVEGGGAAVGVGTGTVLALVSWGLNTAYEHGGNLIAGVFNQTMGYCSPYEEVGYVLCNNTLAREKFVELAKVALSHADYTQLMWAGVGIAGVSAAVGAHAAYQAWKGQAGHYENVDV